MTDRTHIRLLFVAFLALTIFVAVASCQSSAAQSDLNHDQDNFAATNRALAVKNRGLALRADRLARSNRVVVLRADRLSRALLRFNQGTGALPGVAGRTGALGGLGPQGLTGTRGVGIDGVDGTDGKDGADGAAGVGTDGADGKDGLDGADGADGIDGIDGTDGTDGADGEPGPGPTDEQVQQAVDNYCDAHNNCTPGP